MEAGNRRKQAVRAGRLLVASLGLLAGACGEPETWQRPGPSEYPGIEELSWELTPLTTAPDFTTTPGTLIVEVADGEVAFISRSPLSGLILVNGVETEGATASTVKTLAIVGSSGANTIIFDFSGGPFRPGTSTGAGITINLGNGSDIFKLMGSSTATDNLSLGQDASAIPAISFNTDGYKDIVFSNVDTLEMTFSLGGGKDIFDATLGRRGTGGNAYAGDLTVYGGDNNDTLTGGAGNDRLLGDDGIDTLDGRAGDDTLEGGTGNDILTASAGTDTLLGGAGSDLLNAGAPETGGGDIFYGGDDTDVTDSDGPDVDTVSYANRTAALDISVNGTADDGESGELDNVQLDIDVVRGGSGNDTLSSNNTTAQNSQTFYGGAGTDTVSYAERTTPVTLTMGSNVADDGQSGEGDNIRDDVENLVCPAAAVICRVTGNALNNHITSGGGADVLDGGAGDDTFIIGSTAGADVLVGGIGTDTADYAAFGGDIEVTMDNVASTTPGTRIGLDVENVICPTTSTCVVTGNALKNHLTGSTQADTLLGGDGDDFIDGMGGADVIDCGGGSDIVVDTSGTPTTCEL